MIVCLRSGPVEMMSIGTPTSSSIRARYFCALSGNSLLDVAPTLLELAGLAIPEHVQGRSLAPILTRGAYPAVHRGAVRCEFYAALDMPDETFATMYRDERHKMVLYHGHGLGELYDLQEDPGEFENLWDYPDRQSLKLDLMQRSYDASMLAMDRGPERVGPM